MKWCRSYPSVLFLFALTWVIVGCVSTATSHRDERSSLATNQQNDMYKSQKERAIELWYDEHNSAEALILLEKLAAANPEDLEVVELLVVCLLANSRTLEHGSIEHQEALRRARELAQEAKEMGSSYYLMDLAVDLIPPDGHLPVSYSQDPAVDDAMKKGEVLFARNEYAKAIAAYRIAEALNLEMVS